MILMILIKKIHLFKNRKREIDRIISIKTKKKRIKIIKAKPLMFIFLLNCLFFMIILAQNFNNS